MDTGPSAPRARRTTLLVARVAALVVSIGVVALLAAQAGLSGCISTAPHEPEPQWASDPLGDPPAPGASGSATSGPRKPSKPHYFPGPKAPAGPWAIPDEDRPAQAPAQAPQKGKH
jgi:hypothetical protein